MCAWKSVKLYGGAKELCTYSLCLGILAPSIYPNEQRIIHVPQSHQCRCCYIFAIAIAGHCAFFTLRTFHSLFLSLFPYSLAFLFIIHILLYLYRQHLVGTNVYVYVYLFLVRIVKIKVFRFKMNNIYALCAHTHSDSDLVFDLFHSFL